MSIVQFYKSQLQVGANLYPVPPSGATLNWPKGHVIPALAGNYWDINYIEGAQTPSVSAQLYLLDGTTANCPIHVTAANAMWMTRAANYTHDLTAIVGGLKFFDGFSGYSFADAKANSFTIGGSKGEDVRFSATFMLYDSSNGSSGPTLITTPPDASYPYFAGTPIRFQACTFQKKASGDLAALQAGTGNDLDGIVQWNISFTNNVSADMSMKGNSAGTYPYQSPLPIDCNAGRMQATASFTFQANSTQHIAVGDAINIRIKQGSISTQFGMQVAIADTQNMRAIGSGRQMRTYVCTLAGSDNTNPPLKLAAGL